MSNYSRVKKYEQLRNRIEMDKEEDMSILPNSVQRKAILNQKGTETTPPIANREKSERKVDTTPILAAVSESFDNEYLDDVIKEVKQYNIQRGLREEENTQLNILNSLRGTKNQRNQSQAYFEPVSRPTPAQITEEIQAEKEPSLPPMPSADGNDSTTLNLDVVIKELNESIESDKLAEESEYHEKEEQSSSKTFMIERTMLEETKQLRLAVEEYSTEIEDLQSGLGKTNKVLNWILGILIITLCALIGGIGIYLLKLGGVI
ncbi:MAG: hypothetical protein ACRDBX_00170 [Erysipelotrichaceae bacterium]